ERQESISSSISKLYKTNIPSEENPKSTKNIRGIAVLKILKILEMLIVLEDEARGELQKLETHFALECAYVDDK
ncbi:21788_t:CDS:2, partial [Dentiscutata erythropus]